MTVEQPRGGMSVLREVSDFQALEVPMCIGTFRVVL